MTMRPSPYSSATNSYSTDLLLIWVLQLQSRCPRLSSVYLGDLTLRTNGYRMVPLLTSRWLTSDLRLNTFWNTAQDLTRILASNFNLLLAFTQTCSLFSHSILCSGLSFFLSYTILFELHHLLMRLQRSRARTIKPWYYTKNVESQPAGKHAIWDTRFGFMFVICQDGNDFGFGNLAYICYLPSALCMADSRERWRWAREKITTEGHDYLR